MSTTTSLNPFLNANTLTQKEYEKASTNTQKQALFSDATAEMIDEVDLDTKANQSTVNSIINKLQNTDSKNAKAVNFAKNAAANYTKSKTISDFKINGSLKTNNNTITANVLDGKNKGTVTIKFAQDGSYSINSSIKNATTNSTDTSVAFYNSNGKIRQKTKTDGSTKNKTISEYDSTGKINTKTTKNKNDFVTSKTWYSDNGVALNKFTQKEDGSHSNIQYEYNTDKELQGTYKSNYDKNGNLSSTTATIIDVNTKTSTIEYSNGKSVVVDYTKNNEDKWVLDTKTTNSGSNKTTTLYDTNGKYVGTTTNDKNYVQQKNSDNTISKTIKNDDGSTTDAIYKTINGKNVIQSSKTVYPNGKTVEKEYDSTGKIKTRTQVEETGGNKVVQKTTYSSGTPTSKTITKGAGIYKTTENFEYGSDGRVTKKTKKNSKGLTVSETIYSKTTYKNGVGTQKVNTYVAGKLTASTTITTDKNNNKTGKTTTQYDENNKVTGYTVSSYKNGIIQNATKYSSTDKKKVLLVTNYDADGVRKNQTSYREDGSKARTTTFTTDKYGVETQTTNTYTKDGKNKETYTKQKNDEATTYKFSTGNKSAIKFTTSGNKVTATITSEGKTKKITATVNVNGTYTYNGKNYKYLGDLAHELNN